MKNIIFTVFLFAAIISCETKTKQPQQETSNQNQALEIENKNELKKEYLEKGKEIATNAQKVLGKNLMNAINSQGTIYALDFCSEKAIPLTDSSAALSNVNLKRVSDKNRNPNNAANENELKIIHIFKSQIDQGKPIEPALEFKGDKKVGYYPIVTNAMCLQCHGNVNEQVAVETAEKIKTLYPQDKALGYDVNQLRGMWVVEME